MRCAAARRVTRNCANHGPTTFVFKGRGSYRCVRCRAERVSARRRALKALLVQEAGGRCAICGYARSVRALGFHHRDPATKSFGVAQGGRTRSLATMRAEAAKCVLLCANCHMEVEEGIAALPD
jgi:DNA-directed RNA polymerase subunit RPC12/RpoP